MNIIDTAIKISKKAHAGQKYAGEDYFEKHIQKVVSNLEENKHKYFPYGAFTENGGNNFK